ELALWYSLLRLNRKAAPDSTARSNLARGVDPDRDQLLLRRPAPSPLCLLLTTIFGTGAEERLQWQEAARDVGGMVGGLVPDSEHGLVLGVTPKRVLDSLKKYPDANAWVHIGHGGDSSGLVIPGLGEVPPSRWVQCFAGRQLRLAAFLSCNSHELA